MKKIFALILAVAMVACMFAGCSKDNNKTDAKEILVIVKNSTAPFWISVMDGAKAPVLSWATPSPARPPLTRQKAPATSSSPTSARKPSSPAFPASSSLRSTPKPSSRPPRRSTRPASPSST